MKTIAIMLLCAACAGCQTVESGLDVIGDIAAIFTPPDPVPVAGPANAGAIVNGMVCVQMSDGTWRWVACKPVK